MAHFPSITVDIEPQTPLFASGEQNNVSYPHWNTKYFPSFLFSAVIRSQKKMAFATRHLLSRKSSWGKPSTVFSGSITDFAPHHSKNGSFFGILVIKEQEDPSFGTGGPVKTVTASRRIDRTRERKEHSEER